MGNKFSHMDEHGSSKMVDVGGKIETKRIAIAQAIVYMNSNTLNLLEQKALPKGDVLTVSQVAGIMAAKKTSELIPMCHPLALTNVGIQFFIEHNPPSIRIEAEASTVGRTGVEMEAIIAAQISAATIYDMCKAVQKDIIISDVRLLRKYGGKSGLFVVKTEDKKDEDIISKNNGIALACITLSDKGSRGEREDTCGPALVEQIKENITVAHCINIILPDEPDKLQESVLKFVEQGYDLIVTTGGTGLSPRDLTPEALLPLLSRRLHGLEQAMLAEGLTHTKRACISRTLAGTINQTLIIALPGSKRGAQENLSAILPIISHTLEKLAGDMNDCGRK